MWGQDVNAQGGQYGNALQTASADGHEMLLGLGAAGDESGDDGGN